MLLGMILLITNAFSIKAILILIPVYKIKMANHLMVILLSLEVFSLMVLAAFTLFMFSTSMCAPFILCSFSVFVCEACLGLGVLINSSRELGSDYLSILF